MGKIGELQQSAETGVNGNDSEPSYFKLRSRPNGPDTYGNFVVEVTVQGTTESTPAEVWGPKQLAAVNPSAIHNKYFFQKVSEGPWGFVVPLSAQATIQLPLSPAAQAKLQGQRQAVVTVEDVSGLKWQTTVPVK